MNEISNEKLKIIANDEILIEAIREVFLEITEKHKPLIMGESNELVGEKYRAYDQANRYIDECFDYIKHLKDLRQQQKPFNKEV